MKSDPCIQNTVEIIAKYAVDAFLFLLGPTILKKNIQTHACKNTAEIIAEYAVNASLFLLRSNNRKRNIQILDACKTMKKLLRNKPLILTCSN